MLDIKKLGKRFPARAGPRAAAVDHPGHDVLGRAPASSSPSSGPRAPASRRCSTSSRRSTRRAPARSCSTASASPAPIRRRCSPASTAASATSPRTTTCCPGAPPSTTCCSRSKCRARSTTRRARAPQELIGAVGLAGFERYYPHELSGGMRKRAALIRTLVYDPPMILMDEPFAAVDAQTRTQLQARPAQALEPQAQDHHLRHPRHHRGDRARRPRAGADAAAGAHRRRAPDPDPAAAQRQGHLRAAGLRGDLRTHPGGRAMSSADITSDTAGKPRHPARNGSSPAAGSLLARRAARSPGSGARAPSARCSSRRRSHRAAHRRDGGQRQAVHRHRRDAAGVGRSASSSAASAASAAVPAAAVAARRPRRSSPSSWPRWASRNTRWRRG